MNSNLQIGSKIQGVVSNIAAYGLFVEVQPGVTGLVHVSEISWTNKIVDLSRIYKVGDKVDVIVLSIDKESKRVALSIKQLTPNPRGTSSSSSNGGSRDRGDRDFGGNNNPWAKLDPNLKAGSRVQGTVANIAEFGLFVEVQPGITGLVHISEISWTDRITDLSRIYQVDDKIDVIVLAVDKENRKMSLSVKKLTNN